jgi:hypothetical protein
MRSFGLGTLLTCLLAVPVAAGEQGSAERLRVHLMPCLARSRTEAPIPVDVKFDWKGTRLLDGNLEIVYAAGNEVLGRYRSGDLALTPGEQVHRMMLPGCRGGDFRLQVEARMRFISGGLSTDLGTDTIFVPPRSQRSLTVCVSDPRRATDPARFRVVDSLRLDRYDPELRERSDRPGSRDRLLTAYPAHLAPEDLPAFALGYCPFDVVVLAGDGFSLLKKKQLEALARWVGAGGSVCAIAGGNLKPYHAEFLSRLSGGKGARFSLDADGLVRATPALSARWAMYRPGLGRAVVVTDELDPGRDMSDVVADIADSRAWREAVGFLWKVREAELDHFVKKGSWLTEREKRAGRGDLRRRHLYRDPGEGHEYHVMPVQVGRGILEGLIPRTVRLIPLEVIILILLLFLAMIGPVDYFVLGRLRLRKLTWVAFPAVSILFALFTVYLSESYMGMSDHRNSITFVDLGEGGRVLRRSMYEVILAAGNRTAVTEVEDGFFAALDHREFGGDEFRHSRAYGAGEYEASPAFCSGRIPTRFVALQDVRQWTPQLNRVFALGRDAPVAGARDSDSGVNLDWDALEGPPGSRGFKERARRLIFSGGRAEGGAYAFKGSEIELIHERGRSLPRGLLREVTARPEAGLFSVVSQISPSGGANFEDLSILNATAPGEWVLVVVVRKGSDYVVYRRLFHGG